MIEYAKQFGFAPRTAVWELTLSCNMNCLHCGSRAGLKREGNDLSTEEALKLCEELANLGCNLLTLSGGEPFLRPDWDQLAKALTEGGVTVNFISNGQVFSEEIATRAKAAGITNANFSLDGMEESHTRLRRVKGNWQKIIDNIRLCHEMRMSVGIITTITRWNYPELREMHALLEREGVHVWQLQIGTPTGNMSDNLDALLEPEDILDLVPLLAKLKEESQSLRLDVGDNIGYYGGYEEDFRGFGNPPFWLGCGAGLHVVGIESDGNIKGCLSLPSQRNFVDRFIEGNVRTRSLTEIWNDPEAFAYNRQFKVEDLIGFCRGCEYAELCRGGCSWAGFAHAEGRNGSHFCYHRLQFQLQKALKAEVS